MGIVGIAVGLGAQSLVRDTINGLFILLDNQYSQGDVVTVAGICGRVEDVGLRRTVLRDLDGVVHYVPNGHIAVASNLTQEWSRVNLNVSVAYREDIDRVFAIIDRVGRDQRSTLSSRRRSSARRTPYEWSRCRTPAWRSRCWAIRSP